MKTILSIQSHVAFGYVGNRAAVPPLQALGFDVIAINTVQFAHHTGYGKPEGDPMSADHVARVLKGVEQRIPIEQIDALLTGYMGSAAISDVILDISRRMSKKAIWLCDPVMGDVGRGMFVGSDIQDIFKSSVVPAAKIITPNQFELEFLTGTTIRTLEDARDAVRKAHTMGPEIVLLTSLIHEGTKDDEIQMLASHKEGAQYLVTTPRLSIDPAPNGAGDCVSALFLAHNLNGDDLQTALEKTASGIYAVFEQTAKAGTRELALIQSLPHFKAPKPLASLAL